MATVNGKMTSLANEVRNLSGTETEKGIDDMTLDVSEANDEIIAQWSIIQEIKEKANSLPECVDTSSGDATASDILDGKKAWVDGKEVTGKILTYDGSTLQTRYSRETANGFVFGAGMGGDRFVKSGEVYADVEKRDFGDAYPSYVGEGYTFTSEHGFCVEGTMPIYDYTPMPAWYSESTDTDFVFGSSLENPRPTVLEDELYTKIPKTDFGNATASDVRKGKTFTSADGVEIEGTYEESGASVETVSITLTETGNSNDLVAYLTTNNGVETHYIRGGSITKQCIKNSIILLRWYRSSGSTDPLSTNFYQNLNKLYGSSEYDNWAVFSASGNGSVNVSTGYAGGGAG